MQPTRQYGGMPVQFTVPPPVMSMQPQQNLNSPPGIHQSKTSANSRLVRYGNKSDAALPVGNPVMPVMYSHQPLPNQLPLADRKQYTVLEGRAACMMAQPLPVRTTHHAYVSHVEDGPYNFCLQLKSAVEEVLPKLRSILARQQIAVPSNAQLIPGSLVVAKGADDVLRRAVIMKILPDICDVYYIDFGNHEERRYSEIFQLPNSAAELSPAMAMQFCLSDIESLRITDANKEYFTRLLLGKQVLVQVTESPRPAFQCCELLWESRNVREILVSLTVPMQYHFHTPPSDNDSVVNVVYAEGPNQFYVQFKSEKDSLKEIELAMTKYSSEQPTVTDVKSINIGMPVGAIFPDDGNWYRALVMGITGKKVNVFYVDYGNRAEVELSKLCLISREMVAKWNTHAMECCLVGFDTVSPSLYLIEKLEEIVLGKNYKLKLHSILSALRLCVDLIDEEGNSVAEKMKSLPSEKKKSPPMDSQPPQSKPPREKNLVTHQDDDQTSQHSSDSGVLKKNKYQRPPLKADREKTDRGHKFENRNDRNKFEEKSYNFSQHDDRAENNYSSKTDSRSDWKKGAKKPYMDQAEQWTSRDKDPSVDTSRVDKPSDGNKTDWRSTDSTGDRTGWGNDGRGRTERNDRGGSWNNNKFERKPPSIGTDGEWGSKDKPFANKFGDRDNKYGDRDNKYGDRENKYGDRDNKYGDRDNKYGDRDNKFGDRGSRFGDRDNRFGPKGNKFGDRDTKFSSRAHDNKFGGYDKNRGRQNFGHESSSAAPSTEDCWDDTSQLADNRSSVVISEYPHQRIVSGQEYKVVFAHMDAPNDVFMHLENCDPALNKIRAMIDADTSAASRPISKPVLASPVLAKFDQDGLLYRALIKSLAKVDNGEVDVLFVDFGNSSVVPLTEVFAISSELMSIPIQAIHVIITDLPTIPGADLDACQAHFPDEGLTLKPSSTVAVNMVQCVQGTLFLPSGKSVAEAIIADPKCAGSSSAASSAVPVSVVPTSEPPSEVEPASEVPPPTVPAGAWVERLDLLVGQTISAKVVEKLAADLYSLCASSCSELAFPAQSDKRLSFDLTVEEEVIINVRNLLQDKLEVKYYDKNGKSLSDGDSISPVCPLPVFKRKTTFLLSHKEQESIYLQQDDSGSKLVELLNDMFDYYETNGDIPKETLKVNDVCAAQSSLDGNWYRARIEAVSDVYRVRYIDYGNMEEVGFDKTKLLSAQFTMPELCVPVSLPVKYTDLEWCFQRLDALGEAPVECTFIKKDTDKNCWLVDLSAVGAKDNFAVQWIKDNKAESLSTIPADPKFRDPGWDLRKGDLIPIVVTHVDSPDVFWVQLASHLTDIDTLQSKLQELPECSPESNDIFVAKYGEDGLWYRAVPLGDEVRFIDYGNTEVTQDKKNLPENLMFPIKGHAFPVRLCVSPVGNEWSSEGKDAFDAFIEKEDPNDFKKAKIISVDFETVVDLKCGDELLSTILISGGHAVPRDTKLNKREAKNAEVVNKAANCADSSSVGTPKIVVDEAPKDLVTGYVTSAISINDFYFHLDLKTDAIEQMAERLLQADDFEVIEQPSVGDYLIAKIPKDSAWYRVTVLSKQPVEVLLVDYGEVSPATEFRKLPLDLSTIPVLAWHCSANIDDPQVEERFSNLVDKGTAFEIKFTVVKDDKHVVDLSVDGESIKTYQTGKGDVNNVSAQDSAMVKTSNTAETTSPELPPERETQVSDEALPLPPSLGKSVYKDCILVHSNGPYDFYVQTDDDHIQIDEMANALFEADGFPKLDSVKTGDFVVAQYPEDDAYYRAVVIGNDPPVVKFTDNGISSPATSFHELPEDLKRIPQLAVRCSLQSPPGGWTADAIDQFATLLNSETKSIDLKILTRGDPNIVDVEISGSSLTQKLGPDAKKETSVTGEAKPFDSSNQPAEPPKTANDEFPVLVSFATSPTDFYYQKDASAVADLASRLLSAEEFKPLEECVVGKLICAKYPEDELWYRAKVVKAESPIEVFFVDYGNLSEVQELRQLPDDLSVKPPLSVKASLRPVKQTWSDDEIDKFLTVVYEGEMMCSMIQETPDHQVVRLKYQDGDLISYLGRTA